MITVAGQNCLGSLFVRYRYALDGYEAVANLAEEGKSVPGAQLTHNQRIRLVDDVVRGKQA